MINTTELRLGNRVLFKSSGRISAVAVDYAHFEVLAKEGAASFFPVMLKPEVFIQCGFLENKDYPLLPQAREFKLLLPLPGQHKTEIAGYQKSNGECFARLHVNGLPASTPVVHLHALQNLFFTLTGTELQVPVR